MAFLAPSSLLFGSAFCWWPPNPGVQEGQAQSVGASEAGLGACPFLLWGRHREEPCGLVLFSHTCVPPPFLPEPCQYERMEMNQYRLLVQALETELEQFDLCCPENFRCVSGSRHPGCCGRHPCESTPPLPQATCPSTLHGLVCIHPCLQGALQPLRAVPEAARRLLLLHPHRPVDPPHHPVHVV